MRKTSPIYGAGKSYVARHAVSAYLNEQGSIATAARLLVDSDVIFDPKGDQDLQQGLMFYIHGQTAYGEWLKKLNAQDRPPRGKCATYFAENRHLRGSAIKPVLEPLIKQRQQRLAKLGQPA